MASLDDVYLALKLSKREGRERLRPAHGRLLALRRQCRGLTGDVRRSVYEEAVRETLKRTDHDAAPRTVIAGEARRCARVAVIEAVIEALEPGMREVGLEPAPAAAAR